MNTIAFILLGILVAFTIANPAKPKQPEVAKKLPARPKNGTLKISTAHIIDTPKICPEGQRLDSSGNCKVVWSKRSIKEIPEPACIIDCDIPDRDCPEGQKPDANGNCRDEWGRHHMEKRNADAQDAQVEPLCLIGCSIPPRNCPDGQKLDASGNCRDEWFLRKRVKKSADGDSDFMRVLRLPKTSAVKFGFTKDYKLAPKVPEVPTYKPCPYGQAINADGKCVPLQNRFLAKPLNFKSTWSSVQETQDGETLDSVSESEEINKESSKLKTFDSESEESGESNSKELIKAESVDNAMNLRLEELAQLEESLGPLLMLPKVQEMKKGFLESWLADKNRSS